MNHALFSAKFLQISNKISYFCCIYFCRGIWLWGEFSKKQYFSWTAGKILPTHAHSHVSPSCTVFELSPCYVWHSWKSNWSHVYFFCTALFFRVERYMHAILSNQLTIFVFIQFDIDFDKKMVTWSTEMIMLMRKICKYYEIKIWYKARYRGRFGTAHTFDSCTLPYYNFGEIF